MSAALTRYANPGASLGHAGAKAPLHNDPRIELAGATRTVTIPARAEHDGFDAIRVTLPWVCLHCGGPRGEPFETVSWDGSRTLAVHGWSNPCGHVEKYSEVRAASARATGSAA